MGFIVLRNISRGAGKNQLKSQRPPGGGLEGTSNSSSQAADAGNSFVVGTVEMNSLK